jgi:hypothetical protein
VLREKSDVGVAVNNDLQDFYSLSEWRALSGNDLHSTKADPLFINPSTTPYDFRVQDGSPAIDGGIQVPTVTDDLMGTVRTLGTGPDLGAYEGSGGAGGGGGSGDEGGGAGGSDGAPTGLTATLDALLRVNLSWNPTSTTATYSVKRALLPDGPYSRIARGLTKTTYTTGGLTPGVLYWFVVSATEGGVEGPNSAPVSVLVP